MAITFVSGDLVVSLVGGVDGNTYTDNQGTPIELEQLSVTGQAAGTMLLPQTATTVNGVTENAISGEYGSSSEGSLELSADGRSLVIAGYAINAQTYNAAEVSGGPNTYGNAALAQTYSVPTGGTNGAPAGVTPVARVIADINASGTVDTSTALLNVFNENNPRSVATTDGTSFYIGGQGVKGDTTQGVFYAADGASSATAINTTTDVRTVELNSGQLYVSQDSKQGTGGTSNISTVGTGEPTSAATESALPGISQTVTLSNGNGNTVNGSTGTVHLSPENYFFASSTTLYVADGGLPKQGGAGDGGLQKYSLVNGSWNLDYTLSAGLNIVPTGTADPGAGGQGTTGLIGLTGQVNAATGTVSLYATNATVGDLNQTYVLGVTDTLADTTAAQATNESFSTLFTAPADTNVRGIAFAPQVAAVCFAGGTRIRTTRGEVAVESLVVGDLAVTSSGEHRPIRWLGHRTVDCRRHPRPNEVLPVRIVAHAFGAGRPVRDLVLSPGHAVCVDVLGEVLIPASALVNGTTVTQEEAEAVTYWHVELDAHEVIFAENLPCESYLEMGNRGFFIGEAGATTLHAAPDAVAADHSAFCRPFHEGGAVVAFVRERLAARATALGWTLREAAFADLHLLVDGCRVEPELRGLSARFLVPAGADTVWLVSNTGVPAHVGGSADGRTLGVCLAGLGVSDGFSETSIAADDGRLCLGFHAPEAGPQRWTGGRARLPAALWDGCRGHFFLRVDLARPALPRWERPNLDAVEALVG